MNTASLLALALDPSRIFLSRGQVADRWQRDVLLARDRQLLLNCSRQSGKSTVVAALALHTALFTPGGALVLIVAPALRQSEELFAKILAGYDSVGPTFKAIRRTQRQLHLANGSRILCLPAREENIRAFSEVRLLVLDEAARIPDPVYRAVRPMLAVGGGRLVALSTPFGCRGWFHREWFGKGAWRRFHIPWTQCPRIRPDFIEQEREALGDDWVRQEYEGDFRARTGRVYPDWDRALVSEVDPNLTGDWVGGMDFGWRNPFAAVWGVLDRDDVLWIVGEHYRSELPVHDHATLLPTRVERWFCDPSGRNERAELTRRGFTLKPAKNELFTGISTVTARLRTGRLKILAKACPNLVREGHEYHYPEETTGREEVPENRDNHAVDALRYLIVSLGDCRPTLTMPEPEEVIASDESLWTAF